MYVIDSIRYTQCTFIRIYQRNNQSRHIACFHLLLIDNHAIRIRHFNHHTSQISMEVNNQFIISFLYKSIHR